MVIQYEAPTTMDRIRVEPPQDGMNGSVMLRWEDAETADAYLILHEALKTDVSGFMLPLREYLPVLQRKLREMPELNGKLELRQEGITLITNEEYRGLRRGYPVFLTSASAFRVYACSISEGSMTVIDSSGNANTYFPGITVFFEKRHRVFSKKYEIRFYSNIGLPRNFISIGGQLFGGDYGFSDWVSLSPLIDRKNAAPALSAEWSRLKNHVVFCQRNGG